MLSLTAVTMSFVSRWQMEWRLDNAVCHNELRQHMASVDCLTATLCNDRIHAHQAIWLRNLTDRQNKRTEKQKGVLPK